MPDQLKATIQSTEPSGPLSDQEMEQLVRDTMLLPYGPYTTDLNGTALDFQDALRPDPLVARLIAEVRSLRAENAALKVEIDDYLGDVDDD